MRLPRYTSSLLSLTLLGVAVACGGKKDSGTNPPPPTPTISLSLGAAAGTVQAGGNTTVTATLTRSNFTGAVTVTVSGAPTGVTPNVTSSGDTYTVALGTAASTAAGSYPLTVTATGTGVSAATATYTLTVTAPPSIAMALSPTSASVAQGASTTFTATVTPTNFTGATAVAVTGAPTGTTATVSTAATVHTVTVNVGAATVPGTYTLTATASGTGVTSVSAAFALTVTAAAAGSFALSVTPSPVTIQQGGTASATVTIARTNFPGTVNLAASGFPAGVTATLSAASTTANSVTMNLTALAGTVPGTYPIRVEGLGGTTTAVTAVTNFNLIVSAAPAASIALSAAPAALNITQGATATSTINIARTNFPGNVTLAATNLPNGVSAAFTSSPTTGNSATLTLTAASNAALGTQTITITGTGSGITNATTTLSLTVNQGSAGGGNVTFSFCGTAENLPIWFAAQNGNGNWTQVTAGANNTYSFNVSSVGGAAYVTQSGNDFTLTIFYGSQAEMNGRGINACSNGTPNTRTVTGTAAGLGATEQAFVNFGGASATGSVSAGSPNFTINNVPPGVLDLLATRGGIDLMNPFAGLQINKIFLKRGLNPANGGSVGTVDFNSATDAFAPDNKTVTLGGLNAGEQTTAVATFTSAGGGSAALGFALPGTNTTLTYGAIPSSRTIAGDLHALAASAITLSGNVAQAIRVVTSIFRDATNTTLNLGAVLSTPTISSTNGAYARPRAVLARQSDYPSMWVAGFSQTARTVSFTMTAAYIGSAANFDVQVPDFTGVGGWQNTWGPVAGAQTQWQLSANGFVIGGGNQAEGTVTRTASRFGSFTP